MSAIPRRKILLAGLGLGAVVIVGCVALAQTSGALVSASQRASGRASQSEAESAGESESESAGESAGEGEGESEGESAGEGESEGESESESEFAHRPQFVLVGFDTTPLSPARGTEEMLANVNAGRVAGEPQRAFTLFIGTGGMTFDPERRRLPPEDEPFRGVLPRNAYVFHYARTRHDIDVTVENIRRLAERGVEIGAHTVRHLHGRDFTRERWDFELEDHARILGVLGLAAPTGFRAPFRETSDALYDSLAAHGYTYDCSATQNARRWPTRHGEHGVWVFGVPTVHIPGREGPVLLYDLNLDARLRAAALAAGVHGEQPVQAWMDETFERVVTAELMSRYRGSRAPFLVSGHGGFQRPIARFMRHVCGLPEVRCTTFREATAYMDAHPELAGAD